MDNGVYRVLTLTNDSDDYCSLYQKLYGTDEGETHYNCSLESYRWWGTHLNSRYYHYDPYFDR